MSFEDVYRRTLLAVADTGFVRSAVQRLGWRLGVGRFVAGEDAEAALDALRALEASGKHVILDLLGEFVGTEAAAREAQAGILRTLEVVSAAGVEPYMSIKPSQLGMGVSPQLALELASEVVQAAQARGGHVCLDMESAAFVDGTLALLEALRGAGHPNVSTVLQSYLYRTPEDLERMLALSPIPPLRIVKGAYREDAQVAYQRKAEVDEAYRRLVYRAMDAGCHVSVATHDEALLNEVIAYARGAKLAPSDYDLQVLFGVKPRLQDRLVAEGHVLRVYVPFGADWYGYFSRRLAERPANLAFVVRGLFG